IDQDGSVTGAAGTVITVNNPFLHTDACELHEGWNAALCPAGTGFAALSIYQPGAGESPLGTVRVSRSDGEQHLLLGTPGSPRYRSNVLLADEYVLDWSAPQAAHLQINLSAVEEGDALLLSIPYSAGDAYVYRDWWIDAHGAAAHY